MIPMQPSSQAFSVSAQPPQRQLQQASDTFAQRAVVQSPE
jgi:hypothetical protein